MKANLKEKYRILDWFFILVYLLLELPYLMLESFTDEYEHAMSGWFLIHGLLPYRDFFSHHAPLPLFLGVLAYIFPLISSVLILRGLILAFKLLIWGVIFRLTNLKVRPVVYLTMILIGLSTPIFHLQMALTNVLVGFGLLLCLVLLWHRSLYKTPSTEVLMLIWILVSFLCIWSSIATVLPVMIISILLLALIYQQKDWPQVSKLGRLFALGAALHLFFPIFYFFMGEFDNFVWSVFTFNTKYYFPLRLAGSESELRYGPWFQIISRFFLNISETVTLFFNQTVTLLRALWGGKVFLLTADFTAGIKYWKLIWEVYTHQVEQLLILMTLLMLLTVIYLLFRKRISQAIVGLLLFFSLFFRSNEFFHLSAWYLAIAFVSSWLLVEALAQKKRIFSFLFILLILLIGNLELTHGLKVIKQHQIAVPENFQQIANQVKNLTRESEQIMVLDRNMIYYPLSKRLPACKYQYYLPWLHQTDKIRTEMEKCLSSGRAKLLIIPDLSLWEVQELKPNIDAAYKQSDVDPQIFLRQD